MAGYAGYQGVSGDPLVEALKRKRALAEQLKESSVDSSPTSGMGALSRIGQALIGRYADKKATAAEQEYSTGQKRISDAMIGSMFPDAAGQAEADLGAEAPMDIRPAATQERVKSALLQTQVQNMADFTHDPMSAIQFGIGEREKEQARHKPVAAPDGTDLIDPVTGDVRYQNPKDATGKTAAERAAHLNKQIFDDQNRAVNMFSDGAAATVMNPYDPTKPLIGRPEYSFPMVGDVPTPAGKFTGQIGIGGRGAPVAPGGGPAAPSVTQAAVDNQRAMSEAKAQGAAAPDQKVTYQKAQSALADYDAQTDFLVEQIDKALANTAWDSTGFGAALQGVPGMKANVLQNYLKTIKTNIGFDKLQNMRASSPTGGALGAVSDSENRMLQSVLGSLEQAQGTGQMDEALKTAKKQILEGKTRRKEALEKDYRGGLFGVESAAPGAAATTAPVRIQSTADYDALPIGALFISPTTGKVKQKTAR